MGRRLALLIATYEHEDPTLRRLTSPAADVESLAAVLRDPRIAGFEVSVLVNEPHYRVGEAVAELYRDRRRDDLTLLYFTGHGLKDDDGRLYLATSNTRRDSLLFTSLPAEQLDYAMESCTSRQKVLVLDCCYSGAFPAGRGVKADSEVHALERLRGRGRIVLTASDSTQYSFEGDRVHGSATPSVFTRHLVEGLRDGTADLDGDGDITVDELYSYAHDRVMEEMPQQRPRKQSDVEGRIVVARNVGWTLPGYVRNALGSPIAADRLGAIDALLHLHRIGNAMVRAQVVAEIESLAEDDSRAVSTAAAAHLQTFRTSPRPEARETAQPVSTSGRVSAARVAPPSPQPTEPAPTEPRAQDPPMVAAGAGWGPPDGSRAAAEHPSPADRTSPSSGMPRRRLALIATGAVAAVAAAVIVPILATSGGQGAPAAMPAVVSATVAVGDDPDGIDVFDDGGRLAVVAVAAGFVLVDRTTDAVIGGFDLPDPGVDVAVAPGGSRTYVATGRGLTEVDTSLPSAEIRGTAIDGEEVYCVAAAADGNRLYAATRSGVVVLDPRSGAVITTVELPGQKFGLAVSPDSAHIYVANTDANTVSVIDGGTTRVIGTIETGAHTSDVALSPDGARGYVAQESSVAVFATGSNTVITTIPVPGEGIVEAVAVTPDGSRVFAVTRQGGHMIGIDAATLTPSAVAAFDADAVFGDIAVTDDRAYLSLRSGDSLVVVDITGS